MVARFSLQDVNTVAVLDLTRQDPALKDFAGDFTDGAQDRSVQLAGC